MTSKWLLAIGSKARMRNASRVQLHHKSHQFQVIEIRKKRKKIDLSALLRPKENKGKWKRRQRLAGVHLSGCMLLKIERGVTTAPTSRKAKKKWNSRGAEHDPRRTSNQTKRWFNVSQYSSKTRPDPRMQCYQLQEKALVHSTLNSYVVNRRKAIPLACMPLIYN